MSWTAGDFELNAKNYNLSVTNPQRNHATWSDRYGNVRILRYTNWPYYSAERAVWSPLYARYFFAHYWHYSIWIAVMYVMVTFLLQNWMSNRKPYVIKGPLTAWNAFLAVFSAIGFWRISQEFFHSIVENGFEDSICRSYNVNSPSAFWAFLFSLSKVFELIDTLFLVLRKRSVIFLHWYHHAVVIIYVWHGARDVTAASRWFIWMNYGVHTIMYSYYAISSMSVRMPRMISMFITFAQTAQMLVGIAISAYIVALKNRHYRTFNVTGDLVPDLDERSFVCQHTDNNLILSFTIYASFAALFINFMRVTYFSKRGKSADNVKFTEKKKL